MKLSWVLFPSLAYAAEEPDDVLLLQLGHRANLSMVDIKDTLAQLVKTTDPQQAEAFVEKLAVAAEKGQVTIDDATKAALEGMKKTIGDTSEPAIKAAHDEDVRLLDVIISDTVGACSAQHSTDKGEDVAQGSTVTEQENEHKKCRDELVDLVAERDEKCGAYENFRKALTPPSCAVPGSTDGLIDYLTAMQSFGTTNLGLANQYHDACEDAKDEVKTKEDLCGSSQAQFEMAFCEWRVEVHETCHSYTSCYQTAAASLDQAAENAEKNAEMRKLEWRALGKIKCYIDVLISDAEQKKREEAMAACQSLDPDVSHLDINVPALPEPDSCSFGSVAEFPCTDGFTARYAGLSSVRTCTACAALEPHLQKLSPTPWKLVFRQTHPTFFGQNEWSKNPSDPSNANYAVLDKLEDFRKDGKFTFKLHWPESGKEDNIWEQTSNPTQGTAHGGVQGYKAISCPTTGYHWGGLERGSGSSLLDGSVNHGNWWYAVGSFADYSGGIPGPMSVIKKVELWVKTTTPGTWTTLYSKGSFGSAQTSKDDFNKLFQQAGSGIVRRECENCVQELQDVYFKRKKDVKNFDAYESLLVTWRGDVGFHSDFDIYPTLDDAKAEQNAFQFCNGNDPGIGFPRDCAPTQFTGGQWNSLTRGGQANIKYSTVSA